MTNLGQKESCKRYINENPIIHGLPEDTSDKTVPVETVG